MLLPASFSARILPSDENFRWNLFERKISYGNFLPRNLSCGKTAMCKSIVERQTSCAKTCAWFLQNIQILPGRSFLMRQSSHRKTKKKIKFTTQNETMLLKVSRSDMR